MLDTVFGAWELGGAIDSANPGATDDDFARAEGVWVGHFPPPCARTSGLWIK